VTSISTHVDEKNLPTMVDISAKLETVRAATAQAIISFPDSICWDVSGNEFSTKKGPVISTAIIAGTLAAKKTSNLIPFCHSINLDRCSFAVQSVGETEIEILCTVSTSASTGVEMESLVGASVAALTVYDMCKALSHNIVIKKIQLMKKSGGKHDFART